MTCAIAAYALSYELHLTQIPSRNDGRQPEAHRRERGITRILSLMCIFVMIEHR
jgi:hypothetical protein